MKDKIRLGLVDSCISSLKEFGYEDADRENLFTVMVYRKIAISIMQDALSYNVNQPEPPRGLIEAIESLIDELKEAKSE